MPRQIGRQSEVGRVGRVEALQFTESVWGHFPTIPRLSPACFCSSKVQENHATSVVRASAPTAPKAFGMPSSITTSNTRLAENRTTIQRTPLGTWYSFNVRDCYTG